MDILTRNEVICGNILEVLKDIPDEFFDYTIADPPYGISKKRKYTREGKPIDQEFGAWDHISDFGTFTNDWLREVWRVTKGDIYIFCPLERLGWFKYESDLCYWYHQGFVWHKTNPPPAFQKTAHQSSCEGIARLKKGGKLTFLSMKNGRMHNHVEGPICMGKERLGHPTQKPEYVVRWLLETCHEPRLVLDAFCGSGTTSAVCQEMGIASIAVDNEQQWVDTTRRRLAHG